MTCVWFLEHVHAYAIGALDAADRARMEAHLEETATHEGCFEALAEALEQAAAIDRALPPATPSEGLFDSILSGIEDPAPVLRELPPPARRRWTEPVGWGLAMAAGIALLLTWNANRDLEQRVGDAELRAGNAEKRAGDAQQQVAALSEAERERNDCRVALARLREAVDTSQAVLAMIDDPSTRVVAAAPQQQRQTRGSVVVDPEEGRAFLVSNMLPKIPGKDYQLWVIVGSQPPIPAGFVRASDTGAAIGEFDPKLLEMATPVAFAVSLEPEGGSQTPTEVILVAKL